MTTDKDRPAILSIDLHLSIVPIAFLSIRNDSAFKEIGDSSLLLSNAVMHFKYRYNSF
jgi:hypothetical protein